MIYPYNVDLKIEDENIIFKPDIRSIQFINISIEYIVNNLIPKDIPVKFLDYGCGSGYIGSAIAKNIPEAKVTMYDIDSNSIDFAKKTCKHNNIVCRVLKTLPKKEKFTNICFYQPIYTLEEFNNKEKEGIHQFPEVAYCDSDIYKTLENFCEYCSSHVEPNYLIVLRWKNSEYFLRCRDLFKSKLEKCHVLPVTYEKVKMITISDIPMLID